MSSALVVLLSGSGLALVRLLTGLVRSKWIASQLGLEGMGFLAQATQFQLVASSAASLSVVAALIQGAKGKFRERGTDLYRCAFFLELVGMGAFLALVLVCGPHRLSAWLFGSRGEGEEALWVLLAIPLTILSSGFLEACFFVRDRFDRYVANSALHSVLQALAFVGFTATFGLRGILYAVPTAAAILALLYLRDLRRLGFLEMAWFRPRWEPEMARFLLSHGSAMFLTGVGGGFLLLFVRTTLVARMGLAENGILQVPVALSAYGSAIVTNFLWGRIHPEFSKGASKAAAFDLSFALLATFGVAMATWLAAPVLIPLVYSKAFLPAIQYVGLQCVGDVAYFSFFTLAVALLGAGEMRAYVWSQALYYLPFLAAVVSPSLASVRAYLLLHLAGASLALCSLLAFTLRKRLLPGHHSLRFFLLSLLLSLGMALTMAVGPEPLLPRALWALLAMATAMGLWRACYGPEAGQRLKAGRENLSRFRVKNLFRW